jgi:hypothetical protein
MCFVLKLGCAKLVKSLMYGFGDDRNPANDTVNVMEEILIEYITDIVRTNNYSLTLRFKYMFSVLNRWGSYTKISSGD